MTTVTTVSPEVIDALKATLTEGQVMALTAFHEAQARLEPGRGWVPNPLEAMVDIVNVIDNRAKDPRWSAIGHKGVCLQHRAFSCWDTLGGAANFYALIGHAQALVAGHDVPPLLMDCLAVAEGCLAGALVDSLSGSTHYYSPASMLPPGSVPAWVAGATFVAERWGHKFYRAVR